MNRILRFCVWIFLFLVFLASIAFSFLNTEPVVLSFGFTVFNPQPLSLWIILAFALGGLLGLFLGAGLVRNWRSRSELLSLRRRLALLEQELHREKSTPSKEIA